jgi:hypothetical protein
MIASRAGSFMGRSTVPASPAERSHTAAFLPDSLKPAEQRTAVGQTHVGQQIAFIAVSSPKEPFASCAAAAVNRTSR